MSNSAFVKGEEGTKAFLTGAAGHPCLPKTLAETAAGKQPRSQQHYYQINSQGKGKDRWTREILV